MHFSRASIALPIWLFCSTVQSDLIYVASSSKNITTLSLTYEYFASTNPDIYVEDGYFAGFAPEKKYSLSVVDTFKTPAASPAWITLNKHNNILYLVDGVTAGNGSLTAYRTSSKNATGPPVELDSVECLLDGAYAGFYPNGKGLAVAHYTSSALHIYDITASNGTILPLETFTCTMSSPGPAYPRGPYLLAVDLGADKVRQYIINMETLLLDERPALNATPGSGARHGVFTKDPIMFPDGVASYVFYLAAEIAGTITAYRVTYLTNRGGLQFDLLPNGTYSSLELGTPQPDTGGKGITGELLISPDGEFLIASNRRDKKFNGTATQYPPDGQSDSISTFRIRQDLAGRLDFVQSAAAGGYISRTMNLNSAGNLAVIGTQEGNRLAVLERDLGSGLFKKQVADAYVEGDIWGVLWNDYNDI
ncbi:putative isomerase YbhE [Aspergillus pseudoustus]|uniref:Isomerase YbhE n=1 Tax=Aspergillus pseudoustus TaxID=1810923 RepID=A0ABR4IR67_9EURO